MIYVLLIFQKNLCKYHISNPIDLVAKGQRAEKSKWGKKGMILTIPFILRKMQSIPFISLLSHHLGMNYYLQKCGGLGSNKFQLK